MGMLCALHVCLSVCRISHFSSSLNWVMLCLLWQSSGCRLHAATARHRYNNEAHCGGVVSWSCWGVWIAEPDTVPMCEHKGQILSTEELNRSQLQLLGVTAMFIAAYVLYIFILPSQCNTQHGMCCHKESGCVCDVLNQRVCWKSSVRSSLWQDCCKLQTGVPATTVTHLL